MATTASSMQVERLNAEALFDSVGPAYEAAFSSCIPQSTSVEWLLEQLSPKSNVLDIGCGTGRPVCSRLADAGHLVEGIDISNAMLEAARKNVPNATFRKVDVSNFEPADGKKYDAITVYFSLIASLTQQQIRDHLARIFDWLESGGFFVFATVPSDGENMEISWTGRPIVVSSLSQDDIVATLEKIGFTILEAEASMFLPRASEAGICPEGEAWEEPHFFVYARKE